MNPIQSKFPLLSIVLTVFLVSAERSTAQDRKIVAGDGSSVTLMPGYSFSEVSVISEAAPRKLYSPLAGPLFGRNDRIKKYVQGDLQMVTYSGISLLEKWGSEGRPDPEEIILDMVEKERERMKEANEDASSRAVSFEDQWIDFLGRRTRLLTSVATMKNGTRLHLRAIVFRAKDSFYLVRCMSLGSRPDGWASASIQAISDGEE